MKKQTKKLRKYFVGWCVLIVILSLISGSVVATDTEEVCRPMNDYSVTWNKYPAETTYNYQCVDENDVGGNGDVDYVHTSTLNEYDTFDFEDISTDNAVIDSVNVTAVFKATPGLIGASGTISLGLNISDVYYEGDTFAFSGRTYQTVTVYFTSNPATSDPWIIDDFNDAKISFCVTALGAGCTIRVTQAFVNVSYTSDAIIFGQLDGEGGGDDPLYDEVPENESWVFMDYDGFLTIITVDYTNFYLIDTYEYFQNTTKLYSDPRIGDQWDAQTFTVGHVGLNEDFYLCSICLNLTTGDTENTINLSVRTVDGDGKPTDTVLTNATFFWADNISESRPWGDDGPIFGLFNVSVPPVLLNADTRYAIVTSYDKYIGWDYAYYADDSNYTGGNSLYSNDGGSTWNFFIHPIYFTEPTRLFEVRGTAEQIGNVTLTFEWLNNDVWEQYGYKIFTGYNTTHFAFNSDFSGAQETYYWRVNATANDSGAFYQETYWFKTFYIDTVAKRNPLAMYCAFGSFALIPFVWILGNVRRKRLWS